MVQSVEPKNSFFCSIINLEGNYSSLIELIQLVNLKLCNTFIFEANKRLCKAGKLFLQEKKTKTVLGRGLIGLIDITVEMLCTKSEIN